MHSLSLPVANGASQPQPGAIELGTAFVRIGLACIPLAIAAAAATFSPPGLTSIAAALPDAAVTLAGILSAIFAGALVSGLAGFAFSAVAGALLLRLIEPAEAVSVLLVTSLGAQLFSMASLRGNIDWRELAPLLAAGFAGIPLGAHVLQVLPAPVFAAVFGMFLVCYSAFMLARPFMSLKCDGTIPALLSGFAGGVTGGAIAFPGALPAIWCTMRTMPKDRQRGLIQPFIVIMQVATIAYFAGNGIMGTEALLVSLVCTPAVLAGTWLGLALYRRFSDAEFRRAVLVVLLVCGAILVV
jgi:uncharacterized membrane protein YfcA